MKEFINKKDFFINSLKAVNVSDLTLENSKELFRILQAYDPYDLAPFEVSFKMKDNKIDKIARFLNMDADGYSCRNSKLFIKRTELFRNILDKKCKNKDWSKVISALKKIANSPMDLYFGFDIKDDDYIFAFWLIFGGVKRSGEISFWPYNFDKIINDTFNTIKLVPPPLLQKEILNLGFDISKDYVRYKIYYLCREKIMKDSVFESLMKEINSNLSRYKYFYFFSKMYDESANLIKEKLFVEFLENVNNTDKLGLREFLSSIFNIKGINFGIEKMQSILNNCGGRISLIAFEPDKKTTFYLRHN